MYEILTKDIGVTQPSVIKKSAAIFLLITLMCIGSISQAHATELEHTVSEVIAATPTASTSPQSITSTTENVTSILDLPQPMAQKAPFDLPTLEQANSLAPFIRKPENILGDPSSQASSRIPILTGLITSTFGYRKHPVRGKVRHHNGIDLAAKLGMPVLAPAAGRVTFAGVRNGYGNVVEIDHENGYTSLLAHHSALLVKVGDIVDATTIIARAGRTGLATGVHVHVEIRHNGTLINPRVFLSK